VLSEASNALNLARFAAPTAYGFVERLLGTQYSQRLHSKPSMLSDVFFLPESKSILLITVLPKAAARCVVTCYLCSPADGLGAGDLTASLKQEVSRCVSALEQLYTTVAQSVAV
jgi:hypothetical protein